MAGSDADALTRTALEAGGWADMRPTYRALLRRLKQQDIDAFEQASRRYTSDVEPAIRAGDEQPVDAWVAYGVSIAEKLGLGRLVAVDATGLAEPATGRAEPGQVLLYLPDAAGERAIPIIRPADVSTAQEATLELLVGRG